MLRYHDHTTVTLAYGEALRLRLYFNEERDDGCFNNEGETCYTGW